MTKMGFDERWIGLIMGCVTTVTYQIKVNREYTTRIHPQHGLRQGDPLSWGAGSRQPPRDSHGQQLHGDMQEPKEAGG